MYDTGRTKQGYNKTVGTNYIGHFLLTHLLSELMKKSAPSRIINVSSSVNDITGKLDLSYYTTTPNESLRPIQLYSLSKLYLILHAKELGRRLKGIFTIFSGMKSNDSVPVINCRLSLKFFFLFNTFPRYRSDDVLAPSRICANKHNVHNAQRNTSCHFVYLSSGRKVTAFCVKTLQIKL